MKALLLLAVLLFSAFGVYAQQKPVTQAEYVKMLYGLDKDFSGKEEIVDTLRRRGIDFVLTAGIRSLTRTKGRNDADLRQALEEANRRRENPADAILPSAKETDELLAATRKNTLEAVEEMPDFVVKQQIQRSASYAGTGNFRNLDRLVVAVSYRASGQEEYKVLSINGALQTAPETKSSYGDTGGTSSTGEFVLVLSTIFKPESETKFEVIDTDTVNGRRAVIFSFNIERDKAQQLITSGTTVKESTVAGAKGRIWIDRELNRVLKLESDATEIPDTFPVRSARRIINYDWADIGGTKYLLPLLSDVRLTIREQSRTFETRNLIRFREYQKFGSEVTIVEEDETPIEEEKP